MTEWIQKLKFGKNRRKRLRGVALYETLLATFLFTATTLALVASTAGIYRLNEDKGALNSAVAGSHSLIEQILAADFNSSLFYNQQGTAVTISGTEVPATANIPGLQYQINWERVDGCTRIYHVKCTWPDGEVTREYNTNTIKTCTEFDESVAYSYDGSGNPSNEKVYDDVLQGLGIEPQATPEPSEEPSATPTPAPSSTPNGCYLPGTLISMADGTLRAIEDIKVGEEILSYDLENKLVVKQPILETVKHENNPGGYVIINGFKVTPNHPMWINGNWKPAGDTRIGEFMLKEDGSKQKITAIKFIPGEFTVYNFEVKKTHVYFAYSVLAHNAPLGGGMGGKSECGIECI